MSGMQLRAWFSTLAVEWDDVVMLTIPLSACAEDHACVL
jgi:hypothetical protein